MSARVIRGCHVMSDKGLKTIIVAAHRQERHERYKKVVQTSKRYAVHDEENAYKVGDIVDIQESRPYSKTKTWIVLGLARGFERKVVL